MLLDTLKSHLENDLIVVQLLVLYEKVYTLSLAYIYKYIPIERIHIHWLASVSVYV